MTHTITSETVTDHRATLVCACGREYQHPRIEGARAQHATHVEIEAARAALRGETHGA